FQICRRQSLERHQPVFIHCAQWRLRAIRPGRCQLELLMRLRPSMDRREFLAGSAAAVAAATVATRWSTAAAAEASSPRVLVDWHSHFVSNAEMKFFASRQEAPRL